MYEILLYTHSWLRWIVVLLGILLIIQGFNGMYSNRAFKKSHNGMSAGFVGLFHLQVIIGLILYFFYSPVVDMALTDMGAAMKDSTLRFWAVEHIFAMLVAAVTATIGRVKVRKATGNRDRFKAMAIWFTITMVLVALSIPWKMAPLFRGM